MSAIAAKRPLLISTTGRSLAAPSGVILRTMAGCLLALLLFNCSTMQGLKESDMLDHARRDYGRAIQWSLFESARRFTQADASKSVAAESGKYDGIKVSYYDERDYRINEEEGIAHATVEIRYYHETDLVEKTVTDRQTWKFDREKKRWYLESGLPAFR